MRPILTLLALAMALAAGLVAAPQATPPPAAEAAGAAAPDEPGADRVRQALALRAAGDLAGAIAALEAERDEPAVPALVVEALGALYLEAGRPGDALAVLAPRIALPDPDPVVLFNAARAALALGRKDDAERYLKTAVAEAPVSRAALLLWELLGGQQRHREAAAALAPLAAEPVASELERSDPDLAADVALEYARSLIADGAHAEAIAPLRRRNRLRPDEEEGWRLLGEALLEGGDGDLDEAREALARAQEIAEGRRREELAERARDRDSGLDFDELLARAGERRAAGDLEGALAALADAIRLTPRDPRPRLLEVRLLFEMRRLDQALARAEELVEIAGDRPEALYLRGAIRLATGEPARAEADLRRVLQLAPDHLPAMNGLAAALMARGELDEAERLSRRVLELAPGDATATANLRRIEGRRGGGEEGRRTTAPGGSDRPRR